jgi:hypothetical protein
MNLPTVGSLWRDYWAAIKPPDPVDPVQVAETRRAFYAGVLASLTLFRDTVGTDAVSEDQGAVYLEALYRECEAFYRRVKEGKA